MYNSLTTAIANLQNPKSNPAQDMLTNQALSANNWLQAGDYSQLPKGQFFNFQMPNDQLDAYKKYANVNQGGTFALANTGTGGDNYGRTQATALQGKFLQDRFANGAANQYQNSISQAGGNVFSALNQASGAESSTQQSAINALLGLSNSQIFQKKPSIWGQVLGMAGNIGGAALGAFLKK